MTYELVDPGVILLQKSTPLDNIIPLLYRDLGGEQRDRHFDISSPRATIEFAGRICYKALKAKNPDTDSHRGYIHNILEQKHYSVLEHSSYTFLLAGISRADSHEIVRHRHFSFSQESQRFVMQSEPFQISVHPTIEHGGFDIDEYAEFLAKDFEYANDLYDTLKKKGLKHKQAAEAARQVLPNAAAVTMVVTGNVRSWMEFVSKRDHPAADAAIQEIARQVASILARELPEVFDEESRAIWDEEFSQREVQHQPTLF
ncbi:ThyX-like thymidylate synthase [Corynebacterium phage Zion]|uniref:ThyX-like thymidylate synthase n=3 Tax=Corynebacterium virus Zion TaxID=2560397 RepID=A0A2H4P9E4_9CAUD|nr:thymidylate synthase [Corynebacterium phage Zion]ATW58699.1 ThyX-like thymidylate synthase [Corynebacterium phage PotatoChip]ATW58852.1 ThyX-like thymidylate synthase [Corynebacterium phage Zion]AYR03363.1 ThyX-like thymidylate synthase [Corynebacterium phage PeteyPab]